MTKIHLNIYSIILIIIIFIASLTKSQDIYNLNLENPLINIDNLYNKKAIHIHVDAFKKSIERIWSSSYIEIESTQECFIKEELKDDSNKKTLLSLAIEYSLQGLNRLFSSKQNNEKCYHILYLELYKINKIELESRGQVIASYHYKRIDFKLFGLFLFGLLGFYFARDIVENSIFYYLSGMSLGVLGSILVLFLLMLRFIPKKSTAFVTFLGGSTVFYFIGQWLVGHLKNFCKAYQWYLIGYLIFWALVSFIYCYYHGSFKNDKTLKLLEYTLKIWSLLCIFLSTSFKESAYLIYITMILAKLVQYVCCAEFIKRISNKYFPRKRRLLTNDEFQKEAQDFTSNELEKLRDYCRSPNCNSWKVLRRLKHPHRFVEFVDTGDNHVTNDEQIDYEEYTMSQDLVDFEDD